MSLRLPQIARSHSYCCVVVRVQLQVLRVEDELSRYPQRAVATSAYIDSWYMRTAARPTLYHFYAVQQKAARRRYIAFNARRSALQRELNAFQRKFALGIVPTVLAVGTWRPGPGYHARGHAPTLSMAVRRRLASIPRTVLINTNEAYVFSAPFGFYAVR